jgi:hypothetical protein
VLRLYVWIICYEEIIVTTSRKQKGIPSVGTPFSFLKIEIKHATPLDRVDGGCQSLVNHPVEAGKKEKGQRLKPEF